MNQATTKSGAEANSEQQIPHFTRNKLRNPRGFSLPWREGVRGRGNFTLTLALSRQGRGDLMRLPRLRLAMTGKKRLVMTYPFCHCEERQRLRGVAEANSEQQIPHFIRNKLRNLIALTSLRSTLFFCSATLQGRAHEAKASHYISKLCSVILPFDF